MFVVMHKDKIAQQTIPRNTSPWSTYACSDVQRKNHAINYSREYITLRSIFAMITYDTNITIFFIHNLVLTSAIIIDSCIKY